jgi:hypothetical protein
VTTPPRPDQTSRPSIPLSPGGISIAQLSQQGLLTNADMIALGLQKDTTGQTQLSVGVPPNVPNFATASQTFKASGTYTLHTMAADGRIWLASISATFAASAGYGGATDNESVTMKMGSGPVLALTELVITDAGTFDSKQSDVNWNGIPIESGDTIQLVVSASPAMSVFRASGFVAYSVP